VSQVNVVVSCSNRKKHEPETELQFRSYQGQPIEVAAEAWARSTATPGRWKAEDLYAGDHWSIAKEIKALPDVRLWICSAGYGVISPDANIRSYAATFSPGHQDSIANNLQERRTWWGLIGERSLKRVFARHCDERWLVVLSKSYLDVVTDDLADATTQLHSREQLSVLSVGAQLPSELSDRALPCSSSLEHHESLRGTRISLNVRIARFLLSQSIERTHSAWVDLLSQQIPTNIPAQPRREQVSDQELLRFIREECTQRAKHSATGLLRVWRAEKNLACEQKRFKALYQTVTSERIN